MAGVLIWQIGEFFTKLPKLIPPNTQACAHELAHVSAMRVITCIIVRNGVVCGAHIFAKSTVDMGTPIPIPTVDIGPLPI